MSELDVNGRFVFCKQHSSGIEVVKLNASD